jgi:hypothetical protein
VLNSYPLSFSLKDIHHPEVVSEIELIFLIGQQIKQYYFICDDDAGFSRFPAGGSLHLWILEFKMYILHHINQPLPNHLDYRLHLSLTLPECYVYISVSLCANLVRLSGLFIKQFASVPPDTYYLSNCLYC